MVRDAGDPGRARAEKVMMEEMEKLEKTAPKAAAKSSRGKEVWTSIRSALRADLPHVADAVESLMARDAGGAVPVRIQINIYGEDGIDSVSVVHSLHIDKKCNQELGADAVLERWRSRNICIWREGVGCLGWGAVGLGL